MGGVDVERFAECAQQHLGLLRIEAVSFVTPSPIFQIFHGELPVEAPSLGMIMIGRLG